MRRCNTKRGVFDNLRTKPARIDRTLPTAAQNPEDEERRRHTVSPRYLWSCLFGPRLGTGVRNQREQRQEGMPMATSHRGFGWGARPLKDKSQERYPSEKGGRVREEQVTERLGKPVSGSVAGGWESIGGISRLNPAGVGKAETQHQP